MPGPNCPINNAVVIFSWKHVTPPLTCQHLFLVLTSTSSIPRGSCQEPMEESHSVQKFLQQKQSWRGVGQGSLQNTLESLFSVILQVNILFSYKMTRYVIGKSLYLYFGGFFLQKLATTVSNIMQRTQFNQTEHCLKLVRFPLISVLGAIRAIDDSVNLEKGQNNALGPLSGYLGWV